MATSTAALSSVLSPPPITASRIVINLPELIERIGYYLRQHDLHSCVQVCRIWNNVLTPSLWDTINDCSEPWYKMSISVRYLPVDSAEEKEYFLSYQHDIKRHAIAFFEKYGHYIRHFSSPWYILHEAASLSKSKCTNLVSLELYYMWGFDEAPPALPVTNDENDYILYLQSHWRPPIDEVGPDSIINRHEVDRFWLLVHRNPSLVRLSVPYMDSMDYLSQEFYFKTFSRLCHLKELVLQGIKMDISIVLKALPQLERLYGVGLRQFSASQQNHNHLRYLNIGTAIKTSEIVSLLKHLPGLEELRIYKIEMEPLPFVPESKIVRSTEPFPQIRMFSIDSKMSHTMDPFNALIVQLFPGLIRMGINKLSPEIRAALWKHCYHLEVIEAGNKKDREAISAWEERRERDVDRSKHPWKYITGKQRRKQRRQLRKSQKVDEL